MGSDRYRRIKEMLMRIAAFARRTPGKIATGAFILNAGLSKWSADEETAARLHGMAAGTYPFLAKLKPKDFAKLLSATEIALGWPVPGWSPSPRACLACMRAPQACGRKTACAPPSKALRWPRTCGCSALAW